MRKLAFLSRKRLALNEAGAERQNQPNHQYSRGSPTNLLERSHRNIFAIIRENLSSITGAKFDQGSRRCRKTATKASISGRSRLRSGFFPLFRRDQKPS